MGKFLAAMVLLLQLAAPFYVAAENLSNKKGDHSYQLDNLTVTAEKRTSDIQDLGMSISAFSGDDLNDAGITDFKESTRLAPNVYMKDTSVVIRGVSQFYGSKTPAVGLFQDGISLSFGGIHNMTLFDIERIEILKGPQGTLYGKNSEAGVVNIITKEPGNQFTGKVFGEYSWFDTEYGNSYGYIGGGTLNCPVVQDKLFLRLAGRWKDYGGFVKNEYNNDEEAGGDETLNGRVSLKWKPNTRWDIALLADKMDKDYAKAYYKYINGPDAEGRHRVSYNGPYDNGETKDAGQTIRIEYTGDRVNFLSLTGRRDIENIFDVDFDLTSVWDMVSDYVDESTEYSQEFRISSTENNDTFQWLTGFYMFDEDTKISQNRYWHWFSLIGNWEIRVKA